MSKTTNLSQQCSPVSAGCVPLPNERGLSNTAESAIDITFNPSVSSSCTPKSLASTWLCRSHHSLLHFATDRFAPKRIVSFRPLSHAITSPSRITSTSYFAIARRRGGPMIGEYTSLYHTQFLVCIFTTPLFTWAKILSPSSLISETKDGNLSAREQRIGSSLSRAHSWPLQKNQLQYLFYLGPNRIVVVLYVSDSTQMGEISLFLLSTYSKAIFDSPIWTNVSGASERYAHGFRHRNAISTSISTSTSASNSNVAVFGKTSRGAVYTSFTISFTP